MIHYHGSPLSGKTETNVKPLVGKHAMVSFAAQTQLELVAEVCQSFCFDNGAFSAWKSGKELDMKGYAELVDKWYRHPAFDFYVIPDVIDGSEKDNLKMIAEWRSLSGQNILQYGAPVWHMHEPVSVLAEYCHSFQRVCIGSSREYATIGNKLWWSRISEAMGAACDDEGRPKTKLHGLRMLDPTVFSHIPFSSADSTNVARNMGIDNAWRGTYAPQSQATRAAIMMERIEAHCSAKTWNRDASGVQQNMELFG